ncbi:MAG TPA: TIGR03619 family F420-dependent LLM class oxidoreductase [Candidatus Bathyarchaeia archaeon]|nr:TIGR03619 family F420-dependent LLM class oxidoreductase [Candidatus Bathyarchaeia archaeon]
MVHFGVRLPQNADEFPQASPSSILTIARLAEKLGYYSVWVHDHIISEHTIFDPLAVWGFLASATDKIKLGSAGFQISLRHAVWLAREVSSLDVLSNGRLIVGLVPGRREKECETAGVPLSEVGKRTDEGIKVMKTLWTQRNASFSGRFYKFSNVTMMPQPVQKPHPPLLIGGASSASTSRVVRLGDGWVPFSLDADQFRQGVNDIWRKAKEKKRNTDAMMFSTENFVAIVSPETCSRDFAEEYLVRKFHSKERATKGTIIGEPDEIIKMIEEYIAASANHFELRFIARDLKGVSASMELFARTVAPSFT